MRAILAFAAACGSAQPPPAPPPMQVDVVALAPTPVVDSTEYLGALRSRDAAALQPQVIGQIVEIRAKPGDVVDAGALLVRIDPGGQPAALAEARARHSARKAALDLAQTNLARVQQLVATGALPRQELDNAQATVDAAQGDVNAFVQEIEAAGVQLRYYDILAPSHGVVGDIPVRVGDRVSTQTVITTVTDNATLEANISIPIERARTIKLATPIQLVDDTSTEIGAGAVSFISPRVNPDTQSVLVKANIDNRAGKLRAEQVVRARVVWQTRDGLTVPALAITRLGGHAFVFVATAGDRGDLAKQRPVELGELTNNAYVVAKGLAAGDRVITSNVQKLHDGTPVTVAKN